MWPSPPKPARLEKPFGRLTLGTCKFLQLQQYWHLYCFAILGSTSTVIHSVKQRLLRNRPGSALRPLATSCARKITKRIHSSKPASLNRPTHTQYVRRVWAKQ